MRTTSTLVSAFVLIALSSFSAMAAPATYTTAAHHRHRDVHVRRELPSAPVAAVGASSAGGVVEEIEEEPEQAIDENEEFPVDDDEVEDGEQATGGNLAKRGPKTLSGKMSWYYPGLGNCGQHDTSKDLIIALPTSLYAKGKNCNKRAKIMVGNKSLIVKIRDRCPGCKGNDLDVSPAVFKKFAKLDKGIQKITYQILD